MEKHIYTDAVFSYGESSVTVPVQQQSPENPNNYDVIDYITKLMGYLIDNDCIVTYSSETLYWRDADTDTRASLQLV